jgi:hypothetical protein
MKPIDVRSADKVGAFESLLGRGPLTLVLVYADWCGHCHRFRDDTWKHAMKMQNRSMNLASVRDDMLPKTSLANAKLKGYPSLMLVGDDKIPAEMKDPEDPNGEKTNALPSNNRQDVEKLLKTPTAKVNSIMAESATVTKPVNVSAIASMPSANTSGEMVSLSPSAPSPVSAMANSAMPSANATAKTPSMNASMNKTASAMNASMNKTASAMTPSAAMTPSSAMTPPEEEEEALTNTISLPPESDLEGENEPKPVVAGGGRIGNLFDSLTKIAKHGTKAFLKKCNKTRRRRRSTRSRR